MKALFLAAGFGTRLRPLTLQVPKCLVPIHGRPLMDIWLEQVVNAGINEVLVNTHYLSDQVGTYLQSSCYSTNVTCVYEPQLQGTAATIVNNRAFFYREDALVIHADNLCHANLVDFFESHRHRPKECLMTMLTFEADSPSSCGIVELDKRGVVVNFFEKVAFPPGKIANGAIYLLSAEMLDLMVTDFFSAEDFSTQVLPNMTGRIFTHHTRDVLIDIGTPEAYAAANCL
jgi:mannose-1-phosphate guanylyltransferase